MDTTSFIKYSFIDNLLQYSEVHNSCSILLLDKLHVTPHE